MKTLLLHNDGYELSVDITENGDAYYVKFTSTFSGSKDPAGEHTKFEMFLNKESLSTLRNALDVK